MNHVILNAYGLVVTPWKLVGYLGVALFAGRWFVQMLASRLHGRPVLPALFWYMSVSGSIVPGRGVRGVSQGSNPRRQYSGR